MITAEDARKKVDKTIEEKRVLVIKDLEDRVERLVEECAKRGFYSFELNLKSYDEYKYLKEHGYSLEPEKNNINFAGQSYIILF